MSQRGRPHPHQRELKMQRFIELKHVGPKAHVRQLIEELIDRLEEKLQHFHSDAVSIHVLFEENGTHKLSRILLTCHVPGHVVAAHEERREPGTAIREAFTELERQLVKRNAILHQSYRRKQSLKTRQVPEPLPSESTESPA